MGAYLKTYKGKPRAVGNRVLVSDMYFGEQKTAGGLIINSDDGKVHGIYPRWGKVFSKGLDMPPGPKTSRKTCEFGPTWHFEVIYYKYLLIEISFAVIVC